MRAVTRHRRRVVRYRRRGWAVRGVFTMPYFGYAYQLVDQNGNKYLGWRK